MAHFFIDKHSEATGGRVGVAMEKLDFIQQFRAFIKKSPGLLDAKEQVVYLRLLGIWNELRRPEWVPVALKQLMRETGIGRRNTMVDIRRSLEQKGFITSRRRGMSAIREYSLIPLSLDSEASINPIPPKYQDDTSKSINPIPPKYQDDTSTGINLIHIPESTKSKDNIAAAASPDFAEAVNFFSNNIHPIAGEVEMHKLASFLDDYGKDWTLAAIEEAAESNGRSVKYIGSILERWKRDGFKSDRKGKRYGQSIPGGARPSAAEKMRAEQAKWDAQTSGWE